MYLKNINYILTFQCVLLQKSGIIKNILTDLTIDELKNDIICDYSIVDIFKFNKKINK